jgi:hypothetical protein
MGLFTDGNVSTVHDLAAHDTGITGVAGTEGIDLTVKLALAQEELGVELTAAMPQGATLGQVVVTPPLRLWHVFHTLELVYRDAYNNQLNDRYKGKWRQYRELAQWAATKLLETGVGIAAEPVPRAAAPVLSLEAGGIGPVDVTLCASVAWVNARGEQGATGNWALITVSAGCVLVVKAVRPPEVAVGWNVYIGESGEEQTRQNAAPIAVGSVWRQTEPIGVDGPQPGSGQTPSYLRAAPRMLVRG